MSLRNSLFLVICLAGVTHVSAAEARSGWARAAFRRAHPCPATGAATGPCVGYVVDHMEPLCAGGPDSPDNMQWQARAEAQEKDRLEWAVCAAARK